MVHVCLYAHTYTLCASLANHQYRATVDTYFVFQYIPLFAMFGGPMTLGPSVTVIVR